MWCENSIGQVDMYHKIFLDHIVLKYFKTIYQCVGLHSHIYVICLDPFCEKKYKVWTLYPNRYQNSNYIALIGFR